MSSLTFTLAPEDRALIERLTVGIEKLVSEKEEPPRNYPEWISGEQVASSIECSRQNVYKLRDSGSIQHRIKPGTDRTYQYSFDSVVSYLAGKLDMELEEVAEKVSERISL